MIPPRSGDVESNLATLQAGGVSSHPGEPIARKCVEPARALRVLIIEDTPADVDLILGQLQRDGYAPDWQHVETEAAFLAALRPDLDVILCDYAMPDFSGLRALALWRESGLEVPFILVSGTIGEEEAVAAIKKGAADYLLKDRLARLGLAIEHAREQERLRRERRKNAAALRESERTARAVVDALAAYIAIVDGGGRILAVNARWREFARQPATGLITAGEGANYIAVCEAATRMECPAGAQLAAGIREVLAGRAHEFTAEYSCPTLAGEPWFVVRVTSFAGDDSRRAVVSHENITARKRTEERVAQLSRVQAILAGIDRAIVHVPDERKLMDEVCQVAVKKGGFKLAWIGMARENGWVQPVAQAGETAYLEGIHIVTADVPDGRGPVGTAIREGRAVVVGDIDRDARMAPWHNRARQFGLHYVAAFPLRIAGSVVGAFQVYAPRAEFFHQNELSLLTQVSDDISFALTAIADLKARKEAEVALQAREAQLYSFVQQAPAAIAMFDRDMNYLAASQRWLNDYGAGHSDLVGLNHYVIHADMPERWKEVHRAALAGMAQSSDDDLWAHADGSKVWLHWAVRPWLDAEGDIGGIIIMADDITARKLLEQEVLEISAREQRRIGQDLHDDLCQWLAGTEFSASALAQDLAKRSPANAARALKIAESMRQSLSRARMMARGLAPAVIEAEGLSGALRELAANTEEMFRVRCIYDGPEIVQMPDAAAALHLYRIAQEAIHNAVRHGGATQVRLNLELSNSNRLSMRISDNGCGIPDPVPQTSGMGLRTMHYRAGIVGASLDIRPGAAGGTEIFCAFPKDP